MVSPWIVAHELSQAVHSDRGGIPSTGQHRGSPPWYHSQQLASCGPKERRVGAQGE